MLHRKKGGERWSAKRRDNHPTNERRTLTAEAGKREVGYLPTKKEGKQDAWSFFQTR